MNRINLFLMIILISGLGFLSYKFTLGYFSDTETSTGNTFAAASSFGEPSPSATPSATPAPTLTPTPTPSGCGVSTNHVVVNEVYYDVDSTHTGQGSESRWEWIELYNPTSSTVNLTGWSIEDVNDTDPFPGSPLLGPCSFAIVSASTEAELEDQTNAGGNWFIPNGTLFITLTDSNIGNGLHNSNGDSIILKNSSSSIIDAMSYNPDTSQLNPAPSDVAIGHSLERDPDGTDTNTAADFIDRTTPKPGE